MFAYCSSLTSIPNISKWNTDHVTNMRGMFLNCKSLKTLPDLTCWNTSMVKDMSDMFNGCISLKTFPKINVTDFSEKFDIFKNLTVKDS